MAWYSKYKGTGVYNDNDQISTKAAKTRRYLQDQEKKTGVKATQPAKQAGMRNKDGSLWSPQTDMGKDLFRKKTRDNNDRRRINAISQSSGYGDRETAGVKKVAKKEKNVISQAVSSESLRNKVKNIDKNKKVLMNAINKQKRR